MMKKTLLALSMGLVLSGCGGDKAVDAVKSFPYNADVGGMPIGELMDGRDLCTDQSWSSVEIPNSDATRVEFRCNLEGASDYFAEAGKAAIAKFDERQADREERRQSRSDRSAQGRLEQARSVLATWEEAIADIEKHPSVIAMREQIADYEAKLEDPEISRGRRAGLKNNIANASRQLKVNLKHGQDHAKKQLAMTQRAIARLEKAAESEAEDLKREQANYEKQRNELIDNYAANSAEELIAWRVEGDKVYVEDGGILLAQASGEQFNWRYSDLGNVLEVIHDVEVTGPELDSLTPAIVARQENRGFRRKHL